MANTRVPGSRSRWWAGLAILAAAGGLSPVAHAQAPAAPEPAPAAAPAVPTEAEREAAAAAAREAAAERQRLLDEPRFAISQFILDFGTPHPGLPTADELLNESMVALIKTPEGYRSARHDGAGGTPLGPVLLADLNTILKGETTDKGAPKFSIAAIQSVLGAVKQSLERRQLIGVFLEIDSADIDQSGGANLAALADLRPDSDGRTTLTAKIYAPVVTSLRTVAAGDRIKGDTRVNAPEHLRIREASPVQPQQAADETRRDLLKRNEIDEYVLRLNRYPNRRVDVALSADDAMTAAAGSVVVDYLVREAKPWLFYVQGSNTGTKQAGEWRERFGAVLYQLSGLDDSMTLDYVTAGFDTTHAFNGTYEIPLDLPNRNLRLRALGNFTRYDASEVGASNERFTGESYSVGGELAGLIYQNRELFVDLVGGMKFQRASVENNTNPLNVIKGETNFLTPRVGVNLDRYTDEAGTGIALAFEWNLPDAANTDQAQLDLLGRPSTDDSWVSFQFSAEQSLFLEPLVDRDRWLAGQSTLAHELYFNLRGQWVLDDQRVAPNYQQVTGGLYSVRGYAESIASGDSVVIGTAEYRLHIPRLLAVNPDPPMFMGQPFRWSPQQPYGKPDWDFIVRGFVDVGQTINNRIRTFERDNLIVGTGFGFELQFSRNLNVRVDFGWALEEVPAVPVGLRWDDGDNRVHFVGTLLF